MAPIETQLAQRVVLKYALMERFRCTLVSNWLET